VKAYVLEVRRSAKGPQIYVSRTHKGFLRRLFELEVPEVHAGSVEIKAVAREAGSRSKVAVASRQQGLDPVGATVGQRGARVQAVVAELGGEKIDVIEWSEEASSFVAKALSPAQVIEVRIDEEHRIANVVVPERMLSLAIGREGQNARLAAKLTGWRIDIRSDVSVAEAAKAEAEGRVEETPAVSTVAESETPADEPLAAVAAGAESGSPESEAVEVAAVWRGRICGCAGQAQATQDRQGGGDCGRREWRGDPVVRGAPARRYPTRSCVVCRTAQQKRELLRIVRTPDGRIAIDPTGKMPGRGAYICDKQECRSAALDKGSLQRALEVPIPAELPGRADRGGEQDRIRR